MALNLSFFPTDILSDLFDHLLADHLCKLYQTGCKVLIEKLRLCTRTFNYHPTPRRRHLWPKIISAFPNLHHVSIQTSIIKNTSYFDFQAKSIDDADLSQLPSTVRSISLDFDNSFASLLNLPSEVDCAIPFDIIFPHLTSLIVNDGKRIQSPLTELSRIFSMSLTTLCLSSFHHFRPSTSIGLHRGNHLTELSISFERTHPWEDEIKIFPESLRILNVRNLPTTFSVANLPRGLLEFRAIYTGKRVKSTDSFQNWPPKLHSLGLDGAVDLDLTMASFLPPSLTWLSLPQLPNRSDIIGKLPRGLKHLHTAAGTSMVMNFCAPLECCSELPPSLESLPKCFQDPSQWKDLPRTITRVNSSMNDAVFIRNSNARTAVHLPPLLSSLLLSSCAIFPLDRFVRLTELIVDEYLPSESGEDRDFFVSLSNLPLLRKLNILSCNFAENDYSLLDLITTPLRELRIRANAKEMNFKAKWANQLETLWIADPFNVNPSLIVVETSPMPAHVEINLPETLTELNIEKCFTFPLPKNNSNWPKSLTNLTLTLTKTSLEELWAVLPTSLWILNCSSPCPNELEFRAGIESLPTNLRAIAITFGTAEHYYAMQFDHIVKFAATRMPRLMRFSINGTNMELDEL
jgi:hypothetical protein